MQHTCVIVCEYCTIFTRRLGDWLPKLCKAQSGLSRGWLIVGNSQCTVQHGLLSTETAQYTILASSDMQTTKLHCAVSGASEALPPRISQCKPWGQCWARLMKFLEVRQSLHFYKCSILAEQGKVWAKAAQTLWRTTKSMISLNAWWNWL